MDANNFCGKNHLKLPTKDIVNEIINTHFVKNNILLLFFKAFIKKPIEKITDFIGILFHKNLENYYK